MDTNADNCEYTEYTRQSGGTRGVNEEGELDIESGNITDSGSTGASNKRRRVKKVTPNIEKARKRVVKEVFTENQDSGGIVEEGEDMD